MISRGSNWIRHIRKGSTREVKVYFRNGADIKNEYSIKNEGRIKNDTASKKERQYPKYKPSKNKHLLNLCKILQSQNYFSKIFHSYFKFDQYILKNIMKISVKIGHSGKVLCAFAV